MSASDLINRACDRHGISRRGVARFLKVSDRMLRYWVEGRSEPRASVLARLEALATANPGTVEIEQGRDQRFRDNHAAA